jgi:hypothetical protein
MRGMLFHSRFAIGLLTMLLFLVLCGSLSAEEPLDLPALIGLTLVEAHQELGVPAEVYTLRGKTVEQDDVVFYYADHLYLFWFENRVWQVRADGRFSGKVFGLPMGATRERVIDALGRPVLEYPDSLVFHIEDRGYPIQARLYFDEQGLADAYCFRGDL